MGCNHKVPFFSSISSFSTPVGNPDIERICIIILTLLTLGQSSSSFEVAGLPKQDFLQEIACLIYFNALLCPSVAMACGDGLIFKRLKINGKADGCSDFVIAAITFTNGSRFIKLNVEELFFQVLQ